MPCVFLYSQSSTNLEKVSMVKYNNIWQPYAIIKEAILSFHLEQLYHSKTKIEGLFKWGPFDNSIPNNPLKPVNPIKLGVILPKKKKKFFDNYLKNLIKKIELDDIYLKPYKGFREIYGVNLKVKSYEYIDDEEIVSCESEKDILNLYIRKISSAKEKFEFDVLLILIPSEFEEWLEIRKENYYFHLHDKIKLYAATQSIRTQIIREIRIPQLDKQKDLLRSIWWLSAAIYTKAGGTLYKLAEFDERVLYIGISYAIVPLKTSQKILIGVAQLFDEQGNNIRIDLFSTSDFTEPSKNPYLSENASRKIFQRILEIYRSAKMKPPSKVVIHKNTPFNDEEVRGIKQAFSSIDRLELLFIQKQTPYSAIRLWNQTAAHYYPVLRGTAVKLDNNSFLLWTSGSISIHVNGQEKNYYQEQRHIPQPLLVTRFYGLDTLEEVATDIMKLTKMNWNNLQYYNKLPVTIDFASKIARIAKQAEDIPPFLPKDFRYYI